MGAGDQLRTVYHQFSNGTAFFLQPHINLYPTIRSKLVGKLGSRPSKLFTEFCPHLLFASTLALVRDLV
jgi:hypothetical protein